MGTQHKYMGSTDKEGTAQIGSGRRCPKHSCWWMGKQRCGVKTPAPSLEEKQRLEIVACRATKSCFGVKSINEGHSKRENGVQGNETTDPMFLKGIHFIEVPNINLCVCLKIIT